MRLILTRHGHVEEIEPERFGTWMSATWWRVLQSPCAINEIEFTGHDVRVRSINVASHLAGL